MKKWEMDSFKIKDAPTWGNDDRRNILVPHVTAVYVINPEILALDTQSRRGKPFLFYRGGKFHDIPARQIPQYSSYQAALPARERGGIEGDLNDFVYHFVGKKEDLEALLRIKRSWDHYPDESLKINGEAVDFYSLFSDHVPFFNSYPYGDEKSHAEGNHPIRTDLEQFKVVLERYDAQKAAQEEAAKRKTVGYRIKNLFRSAPVSKNNVPPEIKPQRELGYREPYQPCQIPFDQAIQFACKNVPTALHDDIVNGLRELYERKGLLGNSHGIKS